MTRETINNLKKNINAIYEIFDSVEQVIKKPDEMTISLRDCFKIELLQMILYFSASDGKLSAKERDFVNAILEFNASSNDLIEIIDENDIYSTDFENKDCLSLTLLKPVDDMLISKGNESVLPIIIDFMETIAKAVIIIDDNVADQEKEDLNIYFTNLRNKYISEQDIIIGKTFKKNTSSNTNSNNLKDYYLKKKK